LTGGYGEGTSSALRIAQETVVANHPSSEKRARQAIKRTVRNRDIKSAARTYMKRLRDAIENRNAQEAEKVLAPCIKLVDRAVAKGVFPRKTGSRYISRLTAQVAGLKAAGSAAIG